MNPSNTNGLHQENVFSDLKVLDLASFIAGPAATTILSDFGADVIKVEPPGFGDPGRVYHTSPPNPASTFDYEWQLTNRNKRSIALDLKSDASKEIIERLVKWADVVVVNTPQKARQTLGISYEQLAPLNERMIYADLSGYGDKGPEASKPGFDITAFWARSGLMYATHDAGSPPTMPINGFGDQTTALTIYGAIVTALYLRERTGKGRRVSTSLVANGAWVSAPWIQGALTNANFYPQHDRKAPPSALANPYRTADDRWFLLGTFQPKDWPGLVNAIGLQSLLEDPRFSDPVKRSENAKALVDIFDPLFESKPLAYWKDVFEAGHVIYGVVQNADEIVNDPQMLANDIYLPLPDDAGPAKYTVNNPLQISGFSTVAPRRAPSTGENAENILQELGYNAEQVARLRESGAMGKKAA